MMTLNDWETMTLQQLEEAVQYHNRKYWVDDSPEISDPEFDKMVEALRERAPDSAVLDAIGPAGAGIEELDPSLEKCPHDPPMLSLDKCYDEATLVRWFEKFEGAAITTPKIDGVAASIRYDSKGRFCLAATRGNGVLGEVITENVRHIVGLPTQVDVPNLEVRGEAYMPISVFDEHFKEAYLSPRNLTAGALKLKDPTRVAGYDIHFFAYDAIGLDVSTESEKLERLAAMGFETAPAELIEHDDLQEAFDRVAAKRSSLAYETDGVVYKADSIAEQVRLGHTAHHPRYAIAYKFQGDVGDSVLREVHWSVSRTGAINPVGIVDPVKLTGAIVTRVSLHNLSIMENLGGEGGLRLNSRVLMMRRGGVIPNLEKVLEAGDVPVELPTECPGCGAQTYRQNDVLFAHHKDDCRSARLKQIEHFAVVMEIKGFGPKVLEALYDDGIVTEPADFFALTVEALCSLDRVGLKLAEKLVARAQERRTIRADIFLRALGIDELGKHVSKILISHFDSIEAILNVTPEELAAIHTIGEVIARKVTDGLAINRLVIEDLVNTVNLVFPPTRPADADGDDEESVNSFSALSKKSVLFTGTLEAMKRSDAMAQVEALGGTSPSSVVRDLDYLVIGDADMEKFNQGWRSSKLKKAEQFNAQGGDIKIIGESEFLSLLKN
ncbi:MAG: NAD-dependent DNA ligase LigA [Bradymonadaceae bacterium]|nr:NAD-dependent DNA ligase LigA [Lujinxingiaceae bacterium]